MSNFCDPVDCSLPGSSVSGISQARILEWVAISFSRGSSQPRDQTQGSCIAGRLFTAEPPRKPKLGPFCWPTPASGAAAFGALHRCAEHTPQRWRFCWDSESCTVPDWQQTTKQWSRLFWCKFAFGKCFGAFSQSNHWTQSNSSPWLFDMERWFVVM